MRFCAAAILLLIGDDTSTINAFGTTKLFAKTRALNTGHGNQDGSTVSLHARVVSHQDSMYSAPSVPIHDFVNHCYPNIPKSNPQAEGNGRTRPHPSDTFNGPKGNNSPINELLDDDQIKSRIRETESDERLETLKIVREQLELLERFEGILSPVELSAQKHKLFALLPKTASPDGSNHDFSEYGDPMPFQADSNASEFSHQDSMADGPPFPSDNFANHYDATPPETNHQVGVDAFRRSQPNPMSTDQFYPDNAAPHYGFPTNNADGFAFGGPLEDPIAPNNFAPEHTASNYDFSNTDARGSAFGRSSDKYIDAENVGHGQIPNGYAGEFYEESTAPFDSTGGGSLEETVINAPFVPEHAASTHGIPPSNAREFAFRESLEDSIANAIFVPAHAVPDGYQVHIY